MTIAEKIQISADETKFTLFKEGLFYKCYNEDALIFTENVKEYKVSAKYIKSVGADVLSLGFPLTVGGKNNLTLDTIALAIDAISFSEEATSVVFTVKNKDLQNYSHFKESIITGVNEPLSTINATALTTQASVITQRIQDYDLANHTPMECIVFIQELKKSLNL
jgi:uncharacterized protein (UPF0333 family)